ncbi:MAG: hypothetical protein IKU40_02305 [Clostridia bacterium]|nr:hypothetical protein [Clostridia bacterium]
MNLRHYIENPALLHENRLPPRSLLIPAQKSGITHRNCTDSDRITSLNGDWAFCYLADGKIPAEVRGFYSAEYDDSRWDTLEVPSMWQFHGYGTCYYPNVEYPFPVDPPYIHAVNPIGLYRRRISLTAVPDCAILRFDGVESAYFVWVNGNYVGFSKGSRLSSEFDITEYLCEGENILAVQVHRYSDGSYLENQDMLMACGIFRNVTLISCGADYVWDYLLLPTENGFELTADCRTAEDGAVLKAVLYDADGQELCRAESAASGKTELSLPVKLPHLWNAEDPYLYKVVLSLLRDGNAVEIHTKKAGIRFSEIDGHFIKLNGSPITLKGVNRHENNCRRGRAVTAEQIIAELEDIKSCNLNAIRTSHYTNHPLFFEIASELGIYVMDEADIESHGMAETGDMGRLAKMDEWAGAFLDRVSRAYYQDKNETCINLRSLGNEAGEGKNLYACIEWLKEQKPKIPTTYYASQFDAKNPAPFRDTGYMPMSVLEGFSPDGAPVMMLEYAHAMGNSPGGLEDIWRFVYSHDYICGGYVWEFKSHGFARDDEEGRTAYLYGGDFGDLYHWSNFSLDGFHTSDGTPKPAWNELREVSAPVWVERTEDGIEVRNTYDFLPLDGVALHWTLYADNTPVRSGVLPLDGILPHRTKNFAPDLSTDGCTGDFRADFIARRGEEVIAHKQILLGRSESVPMEYKPFEYTVTEEYGRISVTAGDVCIEVEDGLLCRYAVRGQELISSPVRPNFHRAPTDNDGITGFDERHAGEWKRRLVQDLHFGMHTQTYEQFEDRCVIRAVGKILPQSHFWGFDAELTYTISADGVVEIGMKGKPYGGHPGILPRIGVSVCLPEEADRTEWFGRGPGDSYSDRKHASPVGLYGMDIADMNFIYDVPQETGNRENTRFVRVTGENYGICAVGDFSFSCHDFTLENLTSARHRNELRTTAEKYLYIDHRHRGLGSHSCGPEPEEMYELRTGEFDFTFLLMPDSGNEAAFERMKNI